MEKAPKRREPSGRGSPEVWLDAAYDLLIDSGVDAIRIVPLAEKLQLARTSFYWFFEDRNALLAALLDRWRSVNTASLIQRTELYAESITEAIFNLFDCWLDAKLFDSKFEFAIRSWALQSSDVAAEIRGADAARIDALTQMFLRFGFDPLASDVRARTIYLTQIGYISMKSEEDLQTRMTRIPSYVEIFTGHAALPRELDRFFARHDYRPAEKAPSQASKRPRKA
jgi:AcrR family transcriptional regulator